MNPLRLFYLALGWLSVALGIVGIILPILPTTPFLLVAVWAFSRSSPEMAARLRNNPHAGPYIIAWQDHGVIPTKAKVISIIMMTAMGGYLWGWSGLPLWAVASAIVVLVAVAAYILTRPSQPPAT